MEVDISTHFKHLHVLFGQNSYASIGAWFGWIAHHHWYSIVYGNNLCTIKVSGSLCKP